MLIKILSLYQKIEVRGEFGVLWASHPLLILKFWRFESLKLAMSFSHIKFVVESDASLIVAVVSRKEIDSFTFGCVTEEVKYLASNLQVPRGELRFCSLSLQWSGSSTR